MTLEEAIKHAEAEAKELDKLCKRYDDASGYTRSHNEDIRTTDAKKCAECAKEHRQLAEWLKDYKRLLEQENVLDKIRAEIEQKCCITIGRENDPAITLYDVFEIIDKYKEVNKITIPIDEKEIVKKMEQVNALMLEVDKWGKNDEIRD